MCRFANNLAFVVVLSGTALLAASTAGLAAPKKDPAKAALRQMQVQLKQAQDEKAALEQAKVELGTELDALKKKSSDLASTAARANRGKAALEKEVEALRQDKTKLTEEITQVKKELMESQLATRDTRQSLQQETSLKQRLEENLSARGKALEVCETKNKTLYQYHVELINRAQSRGSLAIFAEKEPVFGFKRVQIENLLEEYRDKVDEQKIRSSSFSDKEPSSVPPGK